MKLNAKYLFAIHRLAKVFSKRNCVACIAFLSLPSAQALDYGIFDARSLAMGGSGVASATSQHAVFYNPALLSMYEGEEEDTRNGRVYLPIIVAQVNDTVEDALDVVDDELDDQVSAAVTAFNADTSAANAQAVADATTSLQSGINLIGNREFEGEAFLGFMVSEPSDREGGGFYFGSRAVAGGLSDVTQEDLDLLQDYVEAMNLAAQSGVEAAVTDFPDLFDPENNTLIDPAERVTSAVDISSLVISEWGVAVSKEFEFWGQPVALGITPKIMHVDVYREDFTYTNSDYNYEDDKRSQVTLNTDLGIAMPLGKYFRIGIAAKDIIPQKFEGGNGLSVETKARSRFAAAFAHKWLTVAVDLDLEKNKTLGAGRPSQELSVGTEISLIPWVHFRGGYRQDLEGLQDDVLSGGVGFRTGRFVADAAYAFSENMQGGALQLGWTF